MNKFQKIGGFAAWAEALCYIIGFVIFIFYLDAPSFVDSDENVLFLIENKPLILFTMSIIYTLASLILLVLVLALHERLKKDAPLLIQLATAIGVIWCGVVVASGMIFTVGAESVFKLYASDPEGAATLWMGIGVIQNGLGGGTELLGGVWILVISWVALRAGQLSKSLNVFGLLIAAAGILSIVPSWKVFVDIFGLTQIVWYLWIGAIMLFSTKT